MDKKLIGGIVVVIILVAIAYYLYNSQDSSSTPTPTTKPSFTPTPTTKPTSAPTIAPTTKPTSAPTIAPTTKPTSAPTIAPTIAPTSKPTSAPTIAPTSKPTTAPTIAPTSKPTSSPSTPVPTPSLSELTFNAIKNSFSSKNFYLFNGCSNFTPPAPSGQTPGPRSQIPFILDSGNRLVRGSSTMLDSKSSFTLVPKNIILDAKNSKYIVDVNIIKDGKYATWVKTNRVIISGTNYDNQDTYFIKFMENQSNNSDQIIRLQFKGGCCTDILYMKDAPYVCNAINFNEGSATYQGVVAVPPSIANNCQYFNLVHLPLNASLDSSKLEGTSPGSYVNSLPQLLIKCSDYTKCN